MNDVPFCILPWIHVTSHTDGRTSPCCTWKGFPSPKGAIDYFNSPEQQALREAMLRHDPPSGCVDCLEQQKLGTFSPRDDGWNLYTNHIKHEHFDPVPSLEFIEISFSNICNLSCKMCSSDRSSKWIADSEAMGFPVTGKLINHVAVTDDMLQTLRFIRVLGGEPMLHEDQIVDILSRADRIGTIGRLTVGITTNGMVMPSPELVHLLQRCQNTYWTVSIDAYGDLNNYIRSGSDWNIISDNIRGLIHLSEGIGTWSIDIGTVCMIYNINRLPELADWIDGSLPALKGRHNWFPLHFPEYLSVDRLPSDYIVGLADMYDNMASGLRGSDREWRASKWWTPLAAYLREAAAKEPWFPEIRGRQYAPYKGDSRYLIEKLDGLRGDDLSSVNGEIHEQLIKGHH